MYYLICLIVVLLLYILSIILMPKMKNTKLTNTILIVVILVCYIALVLFELIKCGVYDWNFQYTLPVANVSPFMFTSLIIYIFLPKRIKEYWSRLIGLLSLGMLLATILDCSSRISTSYAFHFDFLLNYIAHLSLSLLGIYLYKSNQIDLNVKKSIISGCLLLGVALTMLILNAIFNTSFFGLSTNDTYNIYLWVLAPTWYLSALLYFLGVTCVMLGGYFYLLLLGKMGSTKTK